MQYSSFFFFVNNWFNYSQTCCDKDSKLNEMNKPFPVIDNIWSITTEKWWIKGEEINKLWLGTNKLWQVSINKIILFVAIIK